MNLPAGKQYSAHADFQTVLADERTSGSELKDCDKLSLQMCKGCDLTNVPSLLASPCNFSPRLLQIPQDLPPAYDFPYLP
jgi:hypothetical protein